jgi:hypothetical protein
MRNQFYDVSQHRLKCHLFVMAIHTRNGAWGTVVDRRLHIGVLRMCHKGSMPETIEDYNASHIDSYSNYRPKRVRSPLWVVEMS